jgi:hypothetical protein
MAKSCMKNPAANMGKVKSVAATTPKSGKK